MLIQFDHLTAMFIAGMLVLLIFAAQRSNQDAQVESAQYYAGRTNMVALTDMLAHDFRNLGAGVDPAAPMILDYKWDTSGRYIEFVSMVDTTTTATADSLKYVLVPSKTVKAVLDDSLQTIQCYELQRLLYNGTAYTISGVSMDTIIEFEIALSKAGGAPLSTDINDAREVHIQMSALSPLGVGKVIQRFRWQTKLQPFNLGLKDL